MRRRRDRRKSATAAAPARPARSMQPKTERFLIALGQHFGAMTAEERSARIQAGHAVVLEREALPSSRRASQTTTPKRAAKG
jgi:hypothetical protein